MHPGVEFDQNAALDLGVGQCLGLINVYGFSPLFVTAMITSRFPVTYLNLVHVGLLKHSAR